MKAEQFRAITGCLLLNELGEPHFLIHKFEWHTIEYNISQFQKKFKILPLSKRTRLQAQQGMYACGKFFNFSYP